MTGDGRKKLSEALFSNLDAEVSEPRVEPLDLGVGRAHGREVEDRSDVLAEVADETRLVALSREELASLQEVTKRSPVPTGPADYQAIPRHVGAGVEVVRGAELGRRFRITKAVSIVGRTENVADVVVKDSNASRHHAALSYRDGAFYVEDLESSNGTIVNGRPVRKVALRDGDLIQCGATILRFRVVGL